MFITILIITMRSAIVFTFGIAIGNRWTIQYNPRLYTLVIERYQPDFQESTYDVRKFVSQQERQAFIDSYTIELMESWFHQDGNVITDDQNSIYINLHEID